MEDTSTPRVNATTLEPHTGRNVLLVGRVLQLRGNSATIDSAGQVSVAITRPLPLVAGNFAQVIGKVNKDLSLRVLSAIDLGPDVDMDLFNKAVELTHSVALQPIFFSP